MLAAGQRPPAGQLLGLPDLDGDVRADIAGAAAITGPPRVPSLGGSTAMGPSAAPSPSRAGACTACIGQYLSCSPGMMTTPGSSALALPSRCRHEGFRAVRHPRRRALPAAWGERQL